MTNLQTQENKPVATLDQYLDKYEGQVSSVLPSSSNFKRFKSIMMMALHQNPQLGMCDLTSIVASCLQAVQIGLEPNTPKGECYLIPRNQKVKGVDNHEQWVKVATFMIGYQGMLELVRRSGLVSMVFAKEVYEGDEFSIDFGDMDKPVTHKPCMDSEKRGAVKGYYAFAKMTDGSTQVEYMSLSDVRKIEARSKATGFSPWKTDFDQMARKTVFKRMSKYLPLSVEIKGMLFTDETTKTVLNSDMTNVKDETDWVDPVEGEAKNV